MLLKAINLQYSKPSEAKKICQEIAELVPDSPTAIKAQGIIDGTQQVGQRDQDTNANRGIGCGWWILIVLGLLVLIGRITDPTGQDSYNSYIEYEAKKELEKEKKARAKRLERYLIEAEKFKLRQQERESRR